MRTARALLGWLILALLLGWPPIHILLARRYHFSTWRYGGFGMYAAPDASDREVHVFISSCQPMEGRGGQEGESRRVGDEELGFFHLVSGGRAVPLALPRLHPGEPRYLAQVVRDLRSVSRPGDFERLAAWVDARLVADSSGPRWLMIVVTEPHLDRHASIVYADAFGFVREGGRWTRVPPVRARDVLSIATSRHGECP